jgi:hypothetical protein
MTSQRKRPRQAKHAGRKPPVKAAAATTRRRYLVSADIVGEALGGLTGRRVRQLAEEGKLPRAARGLYDLVACTKAHIMALRAAAADEMRELDRRSRSAEVEMREARARQLRGELVTVAAFEAELEHYASLVRAQHVAAPSRYAARFPELTYGVAAERLQVIFDEIERSLLQESVEATAPVEASA